MQLRLGNGWLALFLSAGCAIGAGCSGSETTPHSSHQAAAGVSAAKSTGPARSDTAAASTDTSMKTTAVQSKPGQPAPVAEVEPAAKSVSPESLPAPAGKEAAVAAPAEASPAAPAAAETKPDKESKEPAPPAAPTQAEVSAPAPAQQPEAVALAKADNSARAEPAAPHAAAATATGWYRWRGPEQAGVSRETNLPEKWDPDTGENLLWSNDIGGMSSPIVMNNKLYTYIRVGEIEANQTLVAGIETQEALVCVDASTGKILWKNIQSMTQTDVPFHRLGWSNVVGDPATNRVYGLGAQCTLVCLDANTGKEIWTRQMTEEFGMISTFGGRTPSPTVDDEQVYVGGVAFGWGDNARSQPRIFALNKDTGELNWTNGSGGIPVDAPYNTPVVAVIAGQKTVVLGNGDGTVAAYQARTGKKLWVHPVSQRGLNASLTVVGDLIFASSSEENPNSSQLGAVVCIDASGPQPKEVWRHEGITAGFSTPAVAKGRVYAMENTGQLQALDAADGKLLWKKRLGTIGKASVVWADGKLYVPEANGRFWILKPGDKKVDILSKVDLEGKSGREYAMFGSVAIDSGRVFLQAANKIYCIGSKDNQAHTPAADSIPAMAQEKQGDQKLATLLVLPADAVVQPGKPAKFVAKGFNASGQVVEIPQKPAWAIGQLTIPAPPARPVMDRPQGDRPQDGAAPAATAPGDSSAPQTAALVTKTAVDTKPVPAAAATGAPAGPTKAGNLQGQLSAEGEFTPAAGIPQGGAIEAKVGDITGVARVRNLPPPPQTYDFEKAPVDKPPLTWLGAGGKFAVKEKDGNKVLTKLTTMDLYARARTNFGVVGRSDYTLQADVRVGSVTTGDRRNMPDAGIINQRYVLVLLGNHQQLQIHEWPSALPESFNQTISYEWQPDAWYTLKLKVSHPSQGKALVEGKVWKKGEAEPDKWTVRVEDPVPQMNGAAGLYGNSLVTPIKSEIDYDNVMTTPNSN